MQTNLDFTPAPEKEASWDAPISVAALNTLARKILERGIPLLWVAGEVSNFTRASSGHCYFSLKDETAQVRCVMFRHRMLHMDWEIANGMQVEVRASPSFYEARGEFQLNVDFIRRAGLGILFEAFARLKTRLDAEGLFAAESKQPLPAFAQCIGIVTSPNAAALRDVLTTLRRRMPAVPVIIYPAPVQGEGSAAKLVTALKLASAREECDVLILCRGGGSIEDLWSFNEESVARAIAACTIPVVCGVGHETDFTIADFVADARAPTPTAAAELVTPNRTELAARLAVSNTRMQRASMRRLERRMQQVDFLGRRLTHPGERIRVRARHLVQLGKQLTRCTSHFIDQQEFRTTQVQHRLAAVLPDLDAAAAHQQRLVQRLAAAAARQVALHGSSISRLQGQLNALSPQSVLERGYAIVSKTDGEIVLDSDRLTAGEAVQVTFARGSADAQITHPRK
ncbi:MAG: exodeoxyribonuclease VII large subunit [Betaproteobacteria bacterium]